MAVYTHVDDDELSAFLSSYDLGAPLSLKGIAEGVENSNYLLDTEKGRFVLTLYEKRVRRQDLPFFLQLMRHLAVKGLPSAEPMPMTDGSLTGELAGRPAAIINFLEGLAVAHPGPEHCRAVGQAMATLHLTGQDFDMSRENTLGPAHWPELVERIGNRADTIEQGLVAIISNELTYQQTGWPSDLPSGVIHADLFPDNVFFAKGELTGLIDFYFACTDLLVYDIAIAINAWAFNEAMELDRAMSSAIVEGYQAVRPLASEEIAALPRLCRAAALRFLLTRALDWLEPVEGALVAPKNPADYIARLRFHQSVQSPETYADFGASA